MLLYRILRKCDSSNSSSDGSAEDENNLPPSLVIGIVCVLCGVGAACFAGYKFAGFFEMFGGISTVFSVLALLTAVIIVGKGFVQLINILYMSTDTGILITMPVSPVILATLRVISALITSYLIAAGILLPFAIGYGFAVPVNALFWAGVLLYVIDVPLFVIPAAAAVVICFMSIFKIIRNRNTLKYFAVFGTLIMVIACVCFDSLSPSGADLMKTAGAVIGFAKNYIQVIPVIMLISGFMQSGNFLYIPAVCLVTALVLALYGLAAGKLYLKGAVSMQNTAGTSRELTDSMLEKACRARKPYVSRMSAELRMVKRNPVYLLKDFIITFIWPVIFVLIMAVQKFSNQAAPAAGEGEDMLTGFHMPADICLFLTLGVVCGVVVFINMFNDLACSSITREGETFALTKQFPVSLRELIRAKRDLSRNLVGISTIGYLTVGGTAGMIFGVIPWYALLYGLLTGIPLLYLAVDIDMISGILHANLHWDNEAAAVKKSGKLIILSYLSVIVLIIGLIFFYSWIGKHHIPGIPCLLAVPVLLTAAAVFEDRRMYSIAEKKLPEL